MVRLLPYTKNSETFENSEHGCVQDKPLVAHQVDLLMKNSGQRSSASLFIVSYSNSLLEFFFPSANAFVIVFEQDRAHGKRKQEGKRKRREYKWFI